MAAKRKVKIALNRRGQPKLTPQSKRKLGAALAKPSSSGAKGIDPVTASALGFLIFSLLDRWLGPQSAAATSAAKNAERQRRFRAKRAARKK